MKIGAINVAVGGATLILGAVFGFWLGFSLDPFLEQGFYAMTLERVLLRAGHTHGMPIALLNLIVGGLVDHLNLRSRWRRYCSWLAIGALIMPLGLILRGLSGGSMLFVPVVGLGALSLMACAAILLWGSLSPTSQNPPA